MSLRRLIACLSGAALLCGALCVPASAAAPASTSQGTVTVTASGAAGKALRRAGVTLRAPRTRVLVDGSARLTFTVASRTVRENEATLPLRGELRFVRGGRAVRYTSLRAITRTGSVRLTGRRSGRGSRVTILSGTPRSRAMTLDRSRRTVAVRPTVSSLPEATARTLRAGLRLRRVPAGTLGAVAVVAGPQTAGGTSGGTTTGTAGTGVVTPSVAPPSAGAVVGGAITWRLRESFVRYVNTGEGISVQDGAVAGAAESLAEAGGVPLVYQFGFPFRSGWSDAATGAASVAFSGGVRVRYRQHTIDFAAADPEIELNGDASRAIFRLNGADGTVFTGARTVLLNLKPSAAASRTVSPDGKTVTYERIPATVPAAAGDSVFAGFYLAGTPFGWISLTYTIA